MHRCDVTRKQGEPLCKLSNANQVQLYSDGKYPSASLLYMESKKKSAAIIIC